ncbi:sigma-70 family RNA polymerase sigma factor [Actinoalloteichus sp. AHMU CJ021]|uniref:RNA polymerase sigma factor, sigma-70 family n=1 Tax=Actinoalloteichus caeruleus DSM 43889 TaxID=1120930 RepID=A0ABT1JCY8_ACTCY|nr:sigma-70 family RNA polymerase sigma factor [Actinoalloteichus caeruleus]AUS80915.1 sigma-70 family RNA polymerase sigma factor [Actinoalloteichus sp. AHMU CJ021]MCP2330354.1 RNA polymerase sigma factor, sigma-70 family [Actinoalloteichus caeruleus DSM 43889]
MSTSDRDGYGVHSVPRKEPKKGDEESIERLVRRCRAGDRLAWSEVICRFSPVVWTVARSHGLSRPDCEDVCQLTWLRAVEHLDSIRQPEKLGAWLVTASRRESLTLLARRGRQIPFGTASFLEGRTDGQATPEESALLHAEHSQVHLAFQSLPEQHQALLSLLIADPPLHYDEISRTLAIPRGSIGPTRRRLLQRMRDLIDDLQGVLT